MPDVYATITSADQEMLERLATILELRAADPQQRAILEEYTARLRLPPEARLVEVGCGTGAVTRFLVTLPGAGEVVGVDPSPFFVERARELADDPKLSFAVGDARALEFADGSFDAAVFHTALSHVPECEQALAEASRVLRPGGSLAVFDGDYVSTTVATFVDDPLQTCVAATVRELVHDPWLMRRAAALLGEAGFVELDLRGHAYTTTGGEYMQALVDRGADALAAAGSVTESAAAALKSNATARMEAGGFFGHITYVSVIGRKP